jgi:squalene-hopene/tetraprenyl-beta-curcumene cyclase
MILAVFILALAVDFVYGADSVEPSWDPKAAAAYLDGRAEWWLGWSGSARGQGTACLSCHTSMPIALARAALGQRLGETTAGAAETKLIAGLQKRVENWDKIVAAPASIQNPFVPFYSGNRKPSALGTEAVVNALILVNHDVRREKGMLKATTRNALGHLRAQQQKNGAWLWLEFGLNPWEKNAAYYGASLAALAVGTAGKDYYGERQVEASVAALKKYLQTQATGQPLHHRLVALWASSRLPGSLTENEKTTLLAEIDNIQEADGGWSLAKLGKTTAGNWQSHGAYPDGVVSDGYATGLIVLALKGVGTDAKNPRLERGIAWLVRNQRNGTWPAHYPNRARDPHSDVGKFMRDAATAFAALALSETAGASK